MIDTLFQHHVPAESRQAFRVRFGMVWRAGPVRIRPARLGSGWARRPGGISPTGTGWADAVGLSVERLRVSGYFSSVRRRCSAAVVKLRRSMKVA